MLIVDQIWVKTKKKKAGVKLSRQMNHSRIKKIRKF